MMIAEQKTIVTSDGVQLAYKRLGSGAVSLVLLPGWASTKSYFDDMLDNLDTTGLCAIVIDPRGQGASAEGEDYSSERQARDVLAVADAEGANTFIAIGHSMGGKYLQYVSLLAPDRVKGQVLIAPGPAGPVDIPDETIAEWSSIIGDLDALRQAYAAATLQPVRPQTRDDWMEQATRIPYAVLERTLRHCFRDDFAARMIGAQLTIPTLVVAGAHDSIFPVDFVKQGVTALHRNARQVNLDCGHEVPNELPVQTAGLVDAFLSGLGAVATPA